MEDMARLAVVEQSLRDPEKFGIILYELHRQINNILENPFNKKTVKSDVLQQHNSIIDYLKYLGFQMVKNEFVFPKEQTLNNLKMAQVAIERKISLCCGAFNQDRTVVPTSKASSNNGIKLIPIKVLITSNPLLQKLENLLNYMLVYEEKELQELARQQIPIVTLQLMALERVREQQKKIKTGEIKGNDLTFDIAFLMELLGWFKYKFFKWVDAPECETCEGSTAFVRKSTMTTERETCGVELYRCTRCPDRYVNFPRYNDLRTLLRSRRGRCGEWANCFTLFCRALGYDTRYIYDTTDHVWCEVFDYDSSSWLHVDPCEATLNTPLMYSHGWKKQLSYVFAFSRDDLQDVTWRYTMDHKEVKKRRNLCNETELVSSILALRDCRQLQVSEARRQYLAKRNVLELVQLMVERDPNENESYGRISGSKQWRTERGEIGTVKTSHTFEFTQPGNYSVWYYPVADKYQISGNQKEMDPIKTWSAGVFERKNIFRKVESDWRMVYLAREEGEAIGTLSWRVSTNEEYVFVRLSVRANSAVYENGNINWTVKFDDNDTILIKFGEMGADFNERFRSAVLTAELSGGIGDVAWQHAQLFRQSLDDNSAALNLTLDLHKRT